MLLLLDYLDYIGIALYLRDQPKIVLTLSAGGGECNLISIYIKMRERVLNRNSKVMYKENALHTHKRKLVPDPKSLPTIPKILRSDRPPSGPRFPSPVAVVSYLRDRTFDASSCRRASHVRPEGSDPVCL